MVTGTGTGKAGKKSLVVCEAHDIVDSTHFLTEMEIKLLQLCLAQIYQVEEIDENTYYEIDKKKYADIFRLSESAAYYAMVEACKTLMSRTLTLKSTLLDPEQPDKSRTIIHWVSSCRYNPETSSVELKWDSSVIDLLSQLGTDTPYSKYYLEDICELKSIHAIRLYRIVNKWALAKTKTFELNEFRRLMGLTELEHNLFKHLNSQVIKPAIEAINIYTNLTVEVEFIKVGKTVKSLKFTIAKK